MLSVKEPYTNHEEVREQAIQQSREVIRLSKKTINAALQKNMEKAEDFLKQTKISLEKVDQDADTGSTSVAQQEYIEAALLVHYIKEQTILPFTDFNASPHDYIGGVSDFVGELYRYGVQLISNNEENKIPEIYKHITTIYEELLDCNVRGDLRKKLDLVKHTMSKFEDILVKMHLR